MATDAAGLEVLDEAECRRLLQEAEVGRIGVSISALPAIFPVNYRFLDEKVLFYTGEGTKLAAALSGTVVVFEVDAVDPLTRAGWSVQVVGVATVSCAAPEQAAAELACLQTWAPGDRPFLVAIRPQRITGRRLPDRAIVPAG